MKIEEMEENQNKLNSEKPRKNIFHLPIKEDELRSELTKTIRFV